MKRKPRWVLDTNIVVSALLWRGKPGRIIELAGEGEVRLFSSRTFLDELRATLARPKLGGAVTATGRSARDLLSDYRRLLTLVRPSPMPNSISRDRDDDHVISCALGARADCIVTGDDDLLVLGAVQGVAIRTAASVLA